MFLWIFVADAKIIFGYNFGTPLKAIAWKVQSRMRSPGGLISEDEEYFNTGPVAELTTWRKISTECNEVHFLCISDTITSSL